MIKELNLAYELVDQFISRESPLSDKWDHEYGIFLKGLSSLYLVKKKQEYLNFLENSFSDLINDEGKIKGFVLEDYELDNIVTGRTLFDLFKITNNKKYRLAIETLNEQFNSHPKTSFDIFLHKKIFPEILFIDGIYMGIPFLAEYEYNFVQEKDFSTVIYHLIKAYDLNYREQTGLMLHGYDHLKRQIWANKETGNSESYWARGMGWYMVGLVESLDYIPADNEDRQKLISILNDLVTGILKHQDLESGLWYQVIDQGNRDGNYLEASGSAMFLYSLLKASRLGYVNDQIQNKALDTFKNYIYHFIKKEEDKFVLTGTCAEGGLGVRSYRDGSFESYACEKQKTDDLKGLGMLLMCMSEIELLE